MSNFDRAKTEQAARESFNMDRFVFLPPPPPCGTCKHYGGYVRLGPKQTYEGFSLCMEEQYSDFSCYRAREKD